MATRTKNDPKNLIVQVTQITQVNRQSQDIGKYRNALRSAESVTVPNRTSLYDIYFDIEDDAQIISCQQKRKAEILKKNIVFSRNEQPDEQIMEQINSDWFFNFMNDLLDTISWGHSVFQFYKVGDWIKYDLIPRKNIKPEMGIFCKTQNDYNGEPYLDNPSFPNVLEVKYFKRFGLLNAAAPYVIYKRNGLGDYAEFAETYGQPMREGIYDGYDDEVRKKLISDLTNAGRGSIFVHPKGTDVNIIDDANKSGSVDLFDRLIKICNDEISKIYLSNTLTTQQGDKGARSLGEVHKEGEESINITDDIWICNILNFQMTDIFAALGINTKGGKFSLVEKESKDLTKKVAIDVQVANQIPIGDDYWYETYGIPKPDNYDELKAESEAAKAAAEAAKQAQPDPAKPNDKGVNPPQNKGVFRFFR
jgi:Mu-like prophage protein gp29